MPASLHKVDLEQKSMDHLGLQRHRHALLRGFTSQPRKNPSYLPLTAGERGDWILAHEISSHSKSLY